MTKELTAKQFWDQVESNEECGMAEGAAIQAACEFFGIDYGDWPYD